MIWDNAWRAAAAACICAWAAAAQDVDDVRWHTDYDEAVQAAAQEGKPLFVAFGAPWCGWCRAMETDAFAHPDAIRRLRDFVCVKVDIDAQPRVAFAFRIRSVPRVMAANTFGEIVGDRVGYLDAEAFTDFLADLGDTLRTETGGMRLPVVEEPGEADADAVHPPTRAVLVYGDDLVAALADPKPPVRYAALESLKEKGRAALPSLIRALSSDYLGARVGAWEALQALDAAYYPFDPWAPSDERARTLEPWHRRLAEEMSADITEEDLQQVFDRVLAIYTEKSEKTLLLEGDWKKDGRIDAWVYSGGGTITITDIDEDADGVPDKAAVFYPLDGPRVLRMVLRHRPDGTVVESHRIEASQAP